MLEAKDVISPLNINNEKISQNNPNFIETNTICATRDLILAAFDSGSRSVAIVGPKGCYKSALARETARVLGVKTELFSLHPDMTARDLLMIRGTD